MTPCFTRPGGTRQARWLKEFESGQPVEVENYEHGVLDGVSRRYFDDGTVSAEGRYVRGAKDGAWRTWWGSGAVANGVRFDAGKRLESTAYHPNGRVALHGQYKDDLEDGELTWFGEDGAPIRVALYARGVAKKAWRYESRRRVEIPVSQIEESFDEGAPVRRQHP